MRGEGHRNPLLAHRMLLHHPTRSWVAERKLIQYGSKEVDGDGEVGRKKIITYQGLIYVFSRRGSLAHIKMARLPADIHTGLLGQLDLKKMYFIKFCWTHLSINWICFLFILELPVCNSKAKKQSVYPNQNSINSHYSVNIIPVHFPS